MEDLETSEDRVTECISDLYVEPRNNLRKWSEKTKQTCNVRSAYVGQHLASVITGVKGEGTAARGDDLSDGTEVKTCSRVDQLSECKDCNANVLVWQEECPECGSENINIKTDSHWIFSIRNEKELDLLLNKIPRVILILFDKESVGEEKIRLRAWVVNPEQDYYREFFNDYFYNNFKKKSNPAPCNLHPLKYDFYMMEPKLIFHSELDIEDDEVNIQFWDLEDPQKEKMPSSLVTMDKLKELFSEEEIKQKVMELPPEKRSEYTYKRNPDKIKKLQKNQLVELFPFIPEEKRDELEMKEKITKTYNEEYTRR